MSPASRSRPLLVPVTTVLRRPGVRHPFERDVHLGELWVGDNAVAATEPVHIDVVLEAINDSITVTGQLSARYESVCRRCLEPATGQVSADVQEIFERRPTEGETYALDGDMVDLEPMVRDALLLSLPLAPLCREDCAGPAPDRYPATTESDVTPTGEGAGGDSGEGPGDEGPGDETTHDEPPGDPRWAALRQLKLD